MDPFFVTVARSDCEDGQHTAGLGIVQKVEVFITTDQATVHS